MKKPNYYVEKYLTYYDGKEYTGRCSVYNLDTLRSIQQYKNGYDHGKWKFYHSNGKLRQKQLLIWVKGRKMEIFLR